MISPSSAAATLSGPSSSISAASRLAGSPPRLNRGDTCFKIGNAPRELSHKLIALARWIGNGRGASRRSGFRGLFTRCAFMHPRRDGARQRSPKPWLHQARLGRICKDRREIILPQRQEAAGKICSIAHHTQYRPQPYGKKRRVSGRRVFDEAI